MFFEIPLVVVRHSPRHVEALSHKNITTHTHASGKKKKSLHQTQAGKNKVSTRGVQHAYCYSTTPDCANTHTRNGKREKKETAREIDPCFFTCGATAFSWTKSPLDNRDNGVFRGISSTSFPCTTCEIRVNTMLTTQSYRPPGSCSNILCR